MLFCELSAIQSGNVVEEGRRPTQLRRLRRWAKTTKPAPARRPATDGTIGVRGIPVRTALRLPGSNDGSGLGYSGGDVTCGNVYAMRSTTSGDRHREG